MWISNIFHAIWHMVGNGLFTTQYGKFPMQWKKHRTEQKNRESRNRAVSVKRKQNMRKMTNKKEEKKNKNPGPGTATGETKKKKKGGSTNRNLRFFLEDFSFVVSFSLDRSLFCDSSSFPKTWRCISSTSVCWSWDLSEVFSVWSSFIDIKTFLKGLSFANLKYFQLFTINISHFTPFDQ